MIFLKTLIFKCENEKGHKQNLRRIGIARQIDVALKSIIALGISNYLRANSL
jgi:hypothetical protein